MTLLSVDNLSGGAGGKTAVQGVSFSQSPLEKIAIAGETGAGKTSVLKMIAGLMQPTGGQVLLNGERVKGPDEQLIAGNKKIAFLSQHFELRNNYKVHEWLSMANLLDEAAAKQLYETCRIHNLLDRWTDELSGGEKQRIALARLLSTAPSLLLLDEPFSNLDLLHKQQMKTLLEELTMQMKFSSILVSHDALDILSWADTLLLMRNGRILQAGIPTVVYNQPSDEYCAALLGVYNLIDLSGLPVLQHFHQPGKKLFLRPTQVKLTKDATAVSGIVNKILYWGNYYSIDIMLGKQLITLHTSGHDLSVGDETGVKFESDDGWFM